MRMSRKKHYWLVMYRGGVGYILGNFLESKRQLREYLSGGFPDKYEDREIEIDEIFDALLLSKSVRKVKVGDEELIIIHFVSER
jgi:hypothetical protein